MGRVTDTVGTINTTLRTLLMLFVAGIAAVGGYKAYDIYNEPHQELANKQQELDAAKEDLRKANTDLEQTRQEISGLNVKLAETSTKLAKVEVSMRLLKVRNRLAKLTVLDQGQVPVDQTATNETPAELGADTAQVPEDAGTGITSESPSNEAPATDVAESPAIPAPTKLMTRIEFVEVNEHGASIGEPRQFDIEGDMVYVDYLRVTFDDKYIEDSDLDRSTAIALFQRLFGEHQEASAGFVLDEVGTRPTAYGQGHEMSDFERQIWADFWLIANDPNKAEELGIRAAHANAVGMRVRPGRTYEIDLRSTGDMTFRPINPQIKAINSNPPPAQPPK